MSRSRRRRGALRTYDAPGVRFTPRPTAPLGASAPSECEVIAGPAGEQGVADDFHRYLVENVEPGISGRSHLQTLTVCEMLVRPVRESRPVDRGELGG